MQFLIMFIFMKLLSKHLRNNYQFLIQICKIPRYSISQNIMMSNLVILKCDTTAKFEKMAPFL